LPDIPTTDATIAVPCRSLLANRGLITAAVVRDATTELSAFTASKVLWL